MLQYLKYSRYGTIGLVLKCCYLTFQMMWFSSGGTKSVVHTDAVDNINCLYRGEKEFVMVDPKYQDKVANAFHSKSGIHAIL